MLFIIRDGFLGEKRKRGRGIRGVDLDSDNFIVRISYYEIYNEKVYDLLSTENKNLTGER